MKRTSISRMRPTALVAPLAPLMLVALSTLACTESSSNGPSAAPPAAIVAGDPAAEEPAADPAEQETVLAAGDPAAEQPTSGEAASDTPGDAVEKPAQPQPDDDDAADIEPKRVLILGDSLAATGFGVLLEDKLDAHPNITCYRKAKSASGLARPDFYDWFDQGPRQVEFRKPDMVIVVMGGNDGQDLPPWKGSKRVQWQTEEWPGAYRARVDDFLGKVTTPVEGADGAQVLWLGLPMMGMRSLEKKLELIRQIQQDAVAALGDGASYLDTTQFLVNDQGELLQQAVVKGKSRDLRAEDGIHFTMSGSEYLADKVYPEIVTALGLPPDSSAE
ncbi:MAG: DUF459 domain-containing protein [Myxococcales bacterium]|nr:DUF459 domain-containing protein [Myxococcales bacterium]